MIYWFTGQPGSGKSTLALALRSALRKRGQAVVHIDGEFMRELMDNRDYSEPGRVRNILAGQRLASKLDAEGLVVIASFVSPYRRLREAFKQRHDVIEVYVHTRDIRGREGHFAERFEPPLENFVEVDTTGAAVDDCIRRILEARPVSGLSDRG